MGTQAVEPVVACPKCQYRFPLSRALTGPIEAQVAQRLQAEYEERDRRREEEVRRRVVEAAARATEKAKTNQDVELKALREQVTEQHAAIAKLQDAELAHRKRARELQEREQELKLEIERQVEARVKDVEETVTKRALEQHRLKDAEKDKQLADVRRQLEEANRKAQQGSQQLQGEVAELDLEAQLRQTFPLDQFEAVATGQRGADVLQRVVDKRGQVCGTIIWERKNAKNFSESWVPKLREDQRDSRAELAVLVTPNVPKDVNVFGPHGGVWVVTPGAMGPLGQALRAGLLEVERTRAAAEGQAGKQAALIEYVSGTEFRLRVEAMLDPVLAMMDDFEKERRATETNWARRQKRHEQIVRGVSGLWGDISGILGTLPAPKQLQLPAGEEADKEAA